MGDNGVEVLVDHLQIRVGDDNGVEVLVVVAAVVEVVVERIEKGVVDIVKWK